MATDRAPRWPSAIVFGHRALSQINEVDYVLEYVDQGWSVTRHAGRLDVRDALKAKHSIVANVKTLRKPKGDHDG